jgi:ribosome maturation protein Sdo1
MASTPGYKVGRDEMGLTEMDRKVIAELRKVGEDGQNLTKSQAARNLGSTRQRVGQIVDRIAANPELRHLLPESALKPAKKAAVKAAPAKTAEPKAKATTKEDKPKVAAKSKAKKTADKAQAAS